MYFKNLPQQPVSSKRNLLQPGLIPEDSFYFQKNENLPQLPAAPPPPKKYCGKNGIYVRPHHRQFLSNANETDSKRYWA